MRRLPARERWDVKAWSRRGRGGEKRASGEKRAPKQVFRTEFRLKRALRRRFLAGGRICTAAAYEVFPPASSRRRRTHLVRNPVGDRRFGVNSSPEGASAQRRRTEPCLQRQFLAGGHICAASTHETVPVPRKAGPPKRTGPPSQTHQRGYAFTVRPLRLVAVARSSTRCHGSPLGSALLVVAPAGPEH